MRLGWVAIVLLAACVHEPTVRLDHAELTGVQMALLPPRLGIWLTVVTIIDNPNSSGVGVRGVRGQVVLGERYTLPIVWQPPAPDTWLHAGRATQVRVPIEMPIDIAVLLLSDSLGAPVIPFRLTGVVDVTGSSMLKVARDNYPIDLRGTVTREQVLGVVPSFLAPR